MNKTVQRWIDTFKINDPTSESLHYTLFSGFLSKFNMITQDALTDYCNGEVIENRVMAKTKESAKRISELSDERNELIEAHETITSTLQSRASQINNLQQDIYDYQTKLSKERLNTNKIIEEALSKGESHNTAHIETLRNQYKDSKDNYEDQIKELKSDKEILASVVKSQGTSSYDKGVEGEDKLVEILEKSGEFHVLDTHNDNHKGDAVITLNNKSYCIDSKNHTRNVPSTDVEKLIQDIELNKYHGGAIIAWNCPIYDPHTSSIIKQQICYKMIASKPILFISRAKEISHEALISLLINLEDHVVSDDTYQTTQNYDKIKEKIVSIAKRELKRIETQHNSLTRQVNQNKKQRHYWLDVLSEETVEEEAVEEEAIEEYSSEEESSSEESSSGDQLSDIEEMVTDIPTLIKHVSDQSLNQRNSTKDVVTYLITYSKFHNHKLSQACGNLSNSILKDILEEYYKLEYKQGHNYLKRIRPRTSPTWNLSLGPITKAS